jgi:chromatin assembly factor 1 subunit B
LASASDDSHIVVLHPRPGYNWMNVATDRDLSRETLRGHTADVYDLCWSPDSKYILSGAVDRTARVWDVARVKLVSTLSDHLQYVQGVAWDPTGAFFATQSNDRTVRVYKTPYSPPVKDAKNRLKKPKKDEFTLVSTIKQYETRPKVEPATPSAVTSTGVKAHYYLDERVPTFFRRLAFSPDGSFLVTPTAIGKTDEGTDVATTLLYSRQNGFQAPMAQFLGTSLSKPTIVVKPNPVLFQHRAESSNSNCVVYALPYRIIYAVATFDTVVFYDSSLPKPIGVMSGHHLEKITDMTWSNDGLVLFISSIDGYVSTASFSRSSFGVPLPPSSEHYPKAMAAREKFGPIFVEKEKKQVQPISAPPAVGVEATVAVKVEVAQAPVAETVLVPKKRAMLVALDPAPAPVDTPPAKRRIEISTTEVPVESASESQIAKESENIN